MRGIVIALALSLSGLAGCPRTAAPVAPSTLTPAEVVTAGKATIEKWRQAYELRSADALGAMYAQDIDLVVVVEGTALLGWDAVGGMLKERLKLADKIFIRLKDTSVVSLGADAAFAYATMTREIVAAGGSTSVTENGIVTFVLRKSGDNWVIGSEHYSYKRAQ
ncbi:MAG: YybH family protein [Kofleriaceae bacterium]